MRTPYETDYVFVGITLLFLVFNVAVLLVKKEAVIPINKAVGFLAVGIFCVIVKITNLYFMKGVDLDFIVSYLIFQKTADDSFGRWGLTLFYMIGLIGFSNIVASLASNRNST